MHEGHRERLRDRYLQFGAESFNDHELLELLLTYAIPRRNTNDIAHALIERFGSLQSVLAAKTGELQSVPGIGEHAALFLHMNGQMVRRCLNRKGQKPGKRQRLATPADAASYAVQLLCQEKYESIFVVSVDKNIRLLYAERLVTGTLTEAPLYPRRIVESALQHSAHAVLLVHNHPSGDPEPSESDLSATNLVKEALRGIDIQLYDHLIVGQGVVYSCMHDLLIYTANEKDGAAEHFEKPQATQKAVRPQTAPHAKAAEQVRPS